MFNNDLNKETLTLNMLSIVFVLAWLTEIDILLYCKISPFMQGQKQMNPAIIKVMRIREAPPAVP